MLRIPKLEVLEPSSVDEAVAMLAAHEGARPIAGGTDLLPNLKHEVETPPVLVALWPLQRELEYVRERGDAIQIGALTKLDAVARDPLVLRHVPALADAAHAVAGPQIRNMGTIGGNVCLDTRCVYINQSFFWRQALGFCIKKDGTVCHVVAGGRRCVAAASNDSGPVLLALGASLTLQSPRGERTLPVDEFYQQDGVFNQARARDELLTSITIPRPPAGTRMAYKKLRTRAAIDFPELGVAVVLELDPQGERVLRLEIALTALASRPVRVKGTDALQGRVADEATIAEAAELAFQRAKPLTNIAGDPAYRRDMVRVFTARAIRAALERGKA